MKTEQPILITSILANQDFPKNRFISFDGYLGSEGAKSLGVCSAETSLNELAPVACNGIVLIETTAAVSQGAKVQTYDDGYAGPDNGGPTEGYALDAATGANEFIRVLLA